MHDIQRIIKSATHCISSKTGQCTKCGYYREDECENALIHDISELLNELEPRLMAETDFENNPNVDDLNRLPAYMECKRDGCVKACCVGKNDISNSDGYRFWTRKPTKEQMLKTPWPKEDKKDDQQ